MKKLLVLLLLATSITTAFGQSAKFGIKGGLNYGSTGGLSTFSTFTEDFNINGDDKVGYHLGAFAKFKFAGIFLQPELVYTRLTTEFSDSRIEGSSDYKFSKLDIPVLLGLKVIGPLNVKIGPSFQVVLNNELDGFDDIDVEEPENTFTVGYQLGAGIQLGNLGLDLRYEGAFQDNDAISDTNVQDFGFVVDTRPSQWILSLSYILDGGGKDD